MAAEAIKAGGRLGPYELLSPIGAGGMGEVWKARDTRLDRVVAIKFSHAQFTDRFQREARAIAALNHPNIAQIYDVGENYIVMEFVDGAPLRRPESPRQLVEIMVQIADALAVAHAAGFVHRDLKPDNILVTKSGVSKILDFGIARRVTPQPLQDEQTLTVARTDPGMVLGTVAYMSPEQVRGDTVDHRSDIFSLGVNLYELLSGTRPFQRATTVETMHAILKEDAPELPESVAPALRQVVAHAMEKQPERRFQAAQDFAFALRMSGTPTGAVPVAPDRIPRRTWLTAGAAVAGAAFTGVAGYWTGRKRWAGTHPVFRKLTFREGIVTRARFASDGSIVYAAKWGNSAMKLYHSGTNDPVAREIDIPDLSELAAMSSKNELAVILATGRTLARLPLAGGAPRQVLANAISADWSPDGTSLAVAYLAGDKTRIQYPIGKTLMEKRMEVYSVRVSPSGDLVAYTGMESSVFRVGVLDRSGKETVLASFPIQGGHPSRVSWTPDGAELWFDSPIGNEKGIIYAVDLRGNRRTVATLPGLFLLESISRDGKVLLAQWRVRNGLIGLAPGEKTERDLAWVEFVHGGLLLSQDGALCVFSAFGEERYAVCYMRRTDGSPAVRLATGVAVSMSPDNKWIQVNRRGPDIISFLVPTGAGEEQPFVIDRLESKRANIVAWLPDETYLVAGNEPGKPSRLFSWRPKSQELRPIGPEGPLRRSLAFVDPEATQCLVQPSSGEWLLFSIPSGAPRTITGIPAGEQPIGWTSDGHSIWIAPAIAHDAFRISRLDLSTGRTTLFKEVRLPNPGFLWAESIKITPGGRGYVYNYDTNASELYVAEGLIRT